MKGIRYASILLSVALLSSYVSVVSAEDIVTKLMSDSYGDTQGDYPNHLIIYISTNKHPIVNAEVIEQSGIKLGIYNLDAQRNMEDRLAEGLPTPNDPRNMNIEEIQSIVQARFDKLTKEDIHRLFQPVMLVERWDVRKTPAFVFGNGKAVVYGVTNAAVALKYWRQWARENGIAEEGML